MPQIAVFVDAGHLYAQGSTLLKGRKLGRESTPLLEKEALILSGDEDIKIGVQVAKTFGVHLLGIKPAKASQSDNLMMEADTSHEWDEAIVGRWMRCDDGATDSPVRPLAVALATDNASASGGAPSASGFASTSDEFQVIVAAEAKNAIRALSASDLERHAQFLDANQGRIHPDIDRRTLASLRNRLGHDLTDTERKEYRQIFAAALRDAHAGAQSRQ